MTRLRVGVAGTGYWAREIHAPGAARHTELDLVAVWGRDEVRAAELAAPYGAASGTDVEAFLDAVDVVLFAVPPDVQAGLAVRAAAGGCHLLLEKPVALEPAQARAVADAVRKAGTSSVVFFTERFVPDREAWLQDLATRDCGGGRATWLASLLDPGNPFAGSPWRDDRGALWDVGPHALSVLLPVLGPVAEVTATAGRGDITEALLTHESGAVSTMSLSLTIPPAATHFDLAFWHEGGWSERPGAGVGADVAYAHALDELVADIRAGSPGHRCGADFGAEVVDVLFRVQQSRDPHLGDRRVQPDGGR